MPFLKLYFQFIKLALTITLLVVSIITCKVSISKKLNAQTTSEELKFPNPETPEDFSLSRSQEPVAPDTGTPKGHSTPGTTRPLQNCPETPKPLTAIFANNGRDFTHSQYPTFWFYLPYNPEQISYMEFLLVNPQQGLTIYHTAVKLTNQKGIIQISLPQQPDNALNVNQNYRWRFNLECKTDLNNQPQLLVVNGWIRRLPFTSQLENQLEAFKTQKYLVYQKSEIWYDAIANLAKNHFANPDNQQLSSDWSKLVILLNIPWVDEESLVDSELIQPQD